MGGGLSCMTAQISGDDHELPAGLRRERMPEHVAFIVDGNRRWGRKRGLSHIGSYEAGQTAIKNTIRLCAKWNIPVVSFFMFSSENWRRPKDEVDYAMGAFEEALRETMPLFMSVGARVSHIGDTFLLPISLQEQMKLTEEETKNNTNFELILALSYGGQSDIVHACKGIAAKVKNGSLEPEDITKSMFEQELQTNVTKRPYPDLLIRTSGEFRISNYYLWQCAYTEMYFTNTFWPDFGEKEFIKALRSFQQRSRRFGQK